MSAAVIARLGGRPTTRGVGPAPRTCLLVDDSRLIRRVLRGMLERHGFACTEAVNGVEALAACRQAPPDLLVLDWTMPVMNGIEVLRAVKRDLGGTARILICSANADLEHIVQAVDLGADEYLMKPFDAEMLACKLAQLGFGPIHPRQVAA